MALIWDLSVGSSSHSLYILPSKTGCCSIPDHLKKSLLGSVKDCSAGDRLSRLNVLGRQPHVSWLSCGLYFMVQNHPSKPISWNLLLNENKGIRVLHFLQTQWKICISGTKEACLQVSFFQSIQHWPHMASSGTQHKCIHFDGSWKWTHPKWTHPKLCPLGNLTKNYFWSNIILNFEQVTYFSVVF